MVAGMSYGPNNPYRFCSHGYDKNTFVHQALLGVEGEDVALYFFLHSISHELGRPAWTPDIGATFMRATEAQWAGYGVHWVPIDPSRPPRGYSGVTA
jgi:hypothetical protein